MRLSTKAILFNVVLITVVITAVFVTLSIEIRSETQQMLQDVLNRSEKQVVSIQQDNLSQLLWASSQISNNPTLRAAMETYRLEPEVRLENRDELLATIQNELDKIWAGLRHDLLFVTNEAGLVLAANGLPDARPAPGEDLSKLPVLSHALNPSAAIGERNFGVISFQGQHYLVGALPIEMQGYVLGSLSLGDRIDSGFLPNLRAIFGGQTVVTVGQRVIASTLKEPSSGNSGAEVLAMPGPTAIRPDGVARLGDEDYMVTSMKLGTDDSGEPVTLYLLRSLTKALRQPNAKLKKTLAMQALLAIFLGAILTWVAMRTSLRPLERFVAFMKGVAETGDYSRRFRGRRSGVEVSVPVAPDSGTPSASGIQSHNELDLLASGFNSMLAVIETRDHSLKQAHKDLEEGNRALIQKEEELRQSQKMEAIGLLAGGVAHDFNNILTVVSGFSELALRSLDASHEARSSIEEVQKASKSASLITRQLLMLGRKQVFKPRIINLNQIIGELENILRRLIGESVQLIIDLRANPDQVLADPAQIEQILLNLVLNSKDAIASSGTIFIETGNVAEAESQQDPHEWPVQSGSVVITVRDDGCGMDSETLNRIFEPFFTTKEKGKGTGLGLSTVHGIVTQSGGHIKVESQPNQGTSIRVHLPLAREADDRAEETSRASSTMGSETILVVEDEPEVRKMVSKLLGLNGYCVFEAPGPEGALKILEQHSGEIDLLLTDVVMPGMNGVQLHEQAMRLQPGLKTLYMSGYTNDVIGEGGILPDGVHLLQKPFVPESLTLRVRQILDRTDAVQK